VETLEALAERAGGPRFAPGGSAPAAQLTEAELTKMQNDPRYYRDVDQAFVQQVQDGFAKLYPGRRRTA
jgi:hypothetical protein